MLTQTLNFIYLEKLFFCMLVKFSLPSYLFTLVITEESNLLSLLITSLIFSLHQWNTGMCVLCKEHCSAECPCLSLSCVPCWKFCPLAKAAWRLFIHCDNPQILWMPCMDARRVQSGCLDTVAHSYISLRSHGCSQKQILIFKNCY